MPTLEGVHIQRVQKQHSSTIVVIPKLVRRALDIQAGDYLIFRSHPGENIVELVKFIPGEKQNGRDTANPDRKAGPR